eukprot:GDKI01004678.1.p2 GENE.GDKI01004678.1~~GDKI01004678.1.p2  ORF type:complete len:102 (-),score=31.19 GDKI01004678.1:58-363(-)
MLAVDMCAHMCVFFEHIIQRFFSALVCVVAYMCVRAMCHVCVYLWCAKFVVCFVCACSPFHVCMCVVVVCLCSVPHCVCGALCVSLRANAAVALYCVYVHA